MPATPTVMRFEADCMQTFSDCFTALEEGMSINEQVIKTVVIVQMKSVDLLQEM